MQATRKKRQLELSLTGLLVIATLFVLGDLGLRFQRRVLPYSEFRGAVSRGEVEAVTVGPDSLEGTLASGVAFRATRLDDPGLVDALHQAGVGYTAVPAWRGVVYGMLYPMLALAAAGYLFYRQSGSTLNKFGGRGQKLLVAQRPGVGFEDVAGCDEAKREMERVVHFLTHPERYHAMGATLPRGLLLTGPPGTGKTLLARALAAEAGVNFYSLSGSDFVEMYVGVGAARVRSLFAEARKNAPSIVFIDELDALGKKRGHQDQSHDEREQTLNQLLVELDGFDEQSRVLLIGATNRPEVIDPALLRPGRFDHQIVVDAPDREGRLAILGVHARSKKLCSGVSLEKLARSSAGMSGADLANLLNEAALIATSEEAGCISQAHLAEAMEKILAGPIRTSRVLDKQLKRRVAYHEVGHALVAHFSPTADPVHKISIVPRGKAALGYTLQLPSNDSYLMTETELRDRIRVLLGGMAAERLIFDEISTGAENDLERCSQIARRMAAHFGMGGETGLLHTGQDTPASAASLARVDEEARRLLETIHAEATAILESRREALERISGELLRREVLESTEFEALLEHCDSRP
ncbi:MAG: ATP-dependent zinc metalloprotease FtsH [Vulcanimicrobiota bacterium]